MSRCETHQNRQQFLKKSGETKKNPLYKIKKKENEQKEKEIPIPATTRKGEKKKP